MKTITIQGVAEEEYLDDGGTAYGVAISGRPMDPLWVTLRSFYEDAQTAQDHPWAQALVGKTVRVTLEIIE